VDDTLRAPGVPAPELKEGDAVSRYRVVRRIGGGGMGVVYEAHDTLLDRRLAIKVLRDDVVTETMYLRLLREAQALARLSHPNVVAVHDVGRSGGRTFIAMDLIDGGTAADWTAAGPRGWREVLDLYLRAGAGLAAAHDAGLVHRDFKPANLLVWRDGRICVTDFGLARLEAAPQSFAANALTSDITDHGTVMGSPGYMAPEQMLGGAVGAACDVFSFCVALFEALFGGRPFAGQTLGELFTSIVKAELPAATGDVPAGLHARISRGLRQKSDERPTMRELLAELEEERSIHQLARAERLLEEARPLARATGGEAGFARVASRLLRDLVAETPTPRPADTPSTPLPLLSPSEPSAALAEVELSGAHAHTLLSKLASPALASHFMAKEGLGSLGADGTLRFDPAVWYPLPAFVRAAHRLVDELGPRATFYVGSFKREGAPGRSADILDVVRYLDRNYLQDLRWHGRPISEAGPDILRAVGGYACELRGPTDVAVTVSGPWPCPFDRALVSGVILRVRPDAAIEHDTGDPCRARGAPACLYRVGWRAASLSPDGTAVPARRLTPAADRDAFLAHPDGHYLTHATWTFWFADAHLDGTVFRGRPTADDFRALIDLWEGMEHKRARHGSLIDLRDVTEVTPDVFAAMQHLISEQREEYRRRLQLAVLRAPGMVGALITGALAMAGVLHPFEFFDDEAAALVWLGRHDDVLLADLHRLRSEGT